MKRAIIITSIAIDVTILLLIVSGPIFFIPIFFSARGRPLFDHTLPVGRIAYGYHGLGDVFVFVFLWIE
jgi:1,4-dihydroxy-2-naphthoate octaprenyltransferase